MQRRTLSLISVLIVLVGLALRGASIAGAYIIGVGGAVNIGDDNMNIMLDALAFYERQVYADERPPEECTQRYVPDQNPDYDYGDGFMLIKAPTGPIKEMPDWTHAQLLLMLEIGEYKVWRDGIEAAGQCPEELHVIGFSDGGTTIAAWLNDLPGGLGWMPERFGVIGLIDVVRKEGCWWPCLANHDAMAEYDVDNLPEGHNAVFYVNIRNQTPGLFSSCPFLQQGWVGYKVTISDIVQWYHPPGYDPYENNICHEDFPLFAAVPLHPLIENATRELIEFGDCTCDISANLALDETWMYQSLPGKRRDGAGATATLADIDDPLDNTSYTYAWEFELPPDAITPPETTDGGGSDDMFWTFAAPACDAPGGLSDLGAPYKVQVTITGDDFGNEGTLDVQFGICLLGDVNNDTVVNVADRSIINAFWQTGSAGNFTLRDCNLNCDGVVNVADRSIANSIWRGATCQNEVGAPCPFRDGGPTPAPIRSVDGPQQSATRQLP